MHHSCSAARLAHVQCTCARIATLSATHLQIEWLRHNPEHGEEPHQPLLAVDVLAALFQAQGMHPYHCQDMIAALDGALERRAALVDSGSAAMLTVMTPPCSVITSVRLCVTCLAAAAIFLSFCVAILSACGVPGLDDVAVAAGYLARVGICEKIVRTPVPRTYSTCGPPFAFH